MSPKLPGRETGARLFPLAIIARFQVVFFRAGQGSGKTLFQVFGDERR
jgi:hypothetical protein